VLEQIRYIPVSNVVEELGSRKPASGELLELAAGAVDGQLRHGAQDAAVSGSILLFDELVACHVHAPPQGRRLGRAEPRVAHEARVHEDVEEVELGQDARQGVEGQLRPVPGRRRSCHRWFFLG